MKVAFPKRKNRFRLTAESALFTALFGMTFSALCAPALPQAAAQSARQQVNAAVIKKAGDEINSLAKQNRWQDYYYKMNVFIPASVANVPFCNAALKVDAPAHASGSLNRLNYDVSCADGAGWHIRVDVKPDVYVSVLMPREEITRGTVITEDELVSKKYNLSHQHGDLVVNDDEVVGMTAGRTLLPLRPIAKGALQSPILVKRDDEVSLISSIDNVTAQTEGIALKNGRKGDVIKVRNESSQRTVSAVVTDKGVVKAVAAGS
ncbi:flagella basal body P-ring formation protein FlgA [Leminorella grimontii]|uniref:Flagella basal body P-ring formation protein FlgA n=1 Tax=Leminorella grimontii TaxID=82981 RepID=A0AAV5N0V8_9GAMM|nr:flagellar basal body P-ring formation chaperone FlgA [Leminorella grimontii]KFC93554.1 FlgA family flagellar basal-body P-ring formation protein [Leminorella grimontii ATCC 33999 = DSM 5078]GKX55751.1 flagella basal body P-ring formation protein FlgA [Leminorella grimontii]VFS55230.1 flagellar basal body P-ring biosynthesis protein FlgA [Leminorella grimontii]